MKYQIKRGNTLIAEVVPKGNESRKVMGEELVNMSFELPTYKSFQIGDSVLVFGRQYYLNITPTIEKISTRNYRYTLQFASIKYELAKIQYKSYNSSNELTLTEFTVTANAETMINLVVANANRMQSGWTKGVVKETEAKQLDFSTDNLLSALSKISEAFDIEFWVDDDKSIHLTERKPISGYSFEYGKSKGLKSITRAPFQNVNLCTILFAEGSTKNIPANYRNGSKRLLMPIASLHKNTQFYGNIEHTEIFEDIYPKRVGTVTAVDANNPYVFTDAQIDFDLNAVGTGGTIHLIKGVSPKIIFQTGQLAGYRFELKEYGYNSLTKTFTLLKNEDEKAVELPNNLMRPQVGDTYIIEDIVMPQSYITNAEQELQVAGQKYLDKNSKERLQYSAVSDPLKFKELNLNLPLGSLVGFKDSSFGLDANLRILGFSRSLQNRYDVSFDISEDSSIITIVRNYYRQEKEKQKIVVEQRYNAQMARRNWNYAKELHDKTFDPEGYFDPSNIKPKSIETAMLSVGSRAQQFNLPNVLMSVEGSTFKNTIGQLVHLTIADIPKTWSIAANLISGITNNFNYVYVKAERNGGNAVFVISEAQLMLESDPIYYYFLAGSISSNIDGFRRLKTNFGFTQVSPGEITTGKISSPNGADYIEFLEDKININANVTFGASSPAFGQVQVNIDQSKTDSINSAKAYADAQDALKKVEANAYADGKVTAEEQRAIADATNKADAAKTYAVAQDNLLKIQLQAYADGAVDAEEARAIAEAQDKLNVAKAYADAQDNLAKVQANAYADGKVTAEEQRAIADAQTKFDLAKTHAQTLVNNVQIGGRNLAPNTEQPMWVPNNTGLGVSVKMEDSTGKFVRVTPDLDKPVSVYGYYIAEFENGKFSRSMYVRHFHTNNITIWGFSVPPNNWFRIKDESYNNTNGWSGFSTNINGLSIDVKKYKIESGNKATDWSPAPEDLEVSILQSKTDSINSAKAYADAQDALKKVEANAYADGKVTAEEQRAILDATNKANSAKAYADAQDLYYNTISNAYADGKVTAEESARITATANALQAAKDYAIAQDNLSKIETKAYADGIVDATELALIADATAKMEVAKSHAQTLVNNVQIGGRNLVLDGKNFRTTFNATTIENYIYYDISDGKLEPNTEYTLSWLYSTSGNFRISMVYFVNDAGEHQYLHGIEATYNSVVKKEWKFTTGSNPNQSGKIRFDHKGSTDGNDCILRIENVKLEKGNKATPAPEDVQNQIDANKTQLDTQSINVNTLVSKTNFLQNTTVQQNTVATGSLIVGNGQGANAGITGLGGNSDVFLWGGANYNGRFTAPYTASRDGINRWHHPNGNIGFEIGIIDGRLTLNGYHSSGTKLFELDPNRGLVNVSYVMESWTATHMYKLNYTGVYDNTVLVSEITTAITKNNTILREGNDIDSPQYYRTEWDLTTNYSSYEYQNGNHPDNEGYSVNVGFKTNGMSRVDNIPDGWYVIGYFQEFHFSQTTFSNSVNIEINKIVGGAVTEKRILTINK